MDIQMKKLFIVVLPIVFMALSMSVSASPVSITNNQTLHFDFGANAEQGYIKADAKERYSKEKGYGFNQPDYVENTASSGKGAFSDAVKFKKGGIKSDAVFNVDLPNGMYEIAVYAGDTTRVSIAAEGNYIIMDMTGNNAVGIAEIPVTDGQLNILAADGADGNDLTISALEITKMPDNQRKKRVFIGGDSITATYYPLDVSAPLEQGYRGGWGQMLKNYIPDNLYVHNFATAGQYAKGFLESGQFASIENLMQAGDYFIFGFGINDQEHSNETEFAAAMTEMVQKTKAKGGVPIIFTTEGRLADFDENGLIYTPDIWFKKTAKKIAADENIHYIDLHNLSSAYFNAIGRDNTAKLYWVNWSGELDTLHANREGAGHIARLAAEDLIRQEFSDFMSDKLPIYGASGDITVKASGMHDGDRLDLQNLMPSEQAVPIVTASYDDSGNLTACRMETAYLPPFDVLNPHGKSEYKLENIDKNSRVYLMKNGKFESMTRPVMNGYSVPFETSKRLFE